tara:strand:- start:51 stop:323 length:273 start_codon:yes stop_codon:yes gene_type:complete
MKKHIIDIENCAALTLEMSEWDSETVRIYPSKLDGRFNIDMFFDSDDLVLLSHKLFEAAKLLDDGSLFDDKDEKCKDTIVLNGRTYKAVD